MNAPLAPTPPSVAPEPGTRLRGRPLVLARVAWAIVAVSSIGLFVAGIPAEFALLQIPCPTPVCTTGQLPPAGLLALQDLGLDPTIYAAYTIAMDVLFAAVYATVAALIFRRKSDDRLGLFVSLALLTFGTATFGFTMGALISVHPAWEIPVASLHFVGAASFGLFLYVFPDGRFVPHWVGWVALAWIAWQLAEHLFPDWVTDPNVGLTLIETVVWVGALGTVVYSQAYRYRHTSSSAQRQQIKWVVYGISTAFAGFLAIDLALSTFAAAPEPASPGELLAYLVGYTFLSYLVVLLVPVTIGIAMLRYHLFDVDLVINRTVVYTTLTASIIGIYVVVVGGFGTLLQTRGNFFISLLAAGLVAVLFAPLRNRLQRGVNHLMYGERDEPYKVLSRLGERLEATLAPDATLKAIVETVAQALKLPYAGIGLRQDGEFVTVAEYGTPTGESIVLPLAYQAGQVGRLILAPRSPGEEFTASDRRLLDAIARQAGVAVHAVHLTADLRRSRERLVAAREEERRRLRRDLHDGLGPQLAAQTLKVGSARSLYPRDPAAADTLLAGLEADMEAALADVRRLIYNLRPPTLDELGLAGAIREAATQYAGNQGKNPDLRISVDAPERLPHLPAAVEVATYRIAQEAMTNVVRHANARTCLVRLSPDDVLELEITDDGIGVPQDHPAGVGLASMRERALELGGTCEILSRPNGGTRVLARLPLPGGGQGSRADLTLPKEQEG